MKFMKLLHTHTHTDAYKPIADAYNIFFRFLFKKNPEKNNKY